MNVLQLDDYRPVPRPERNIVAVIHRHSQEVSDRGEVQVRRYLKLDNAISLTTKWAMTKGRAGDVIIIHHELTGLEIGTIKVYRKGHMSVKWIFEE